MTALGTHTFALEGLSNAFLRRRCAIASIVADLFCTEDRESHVFRLDRWPGVDHFFDDNGSGDQYHVVFRGPAVCAYGNMHEAAIYELLDAYGSPDAFDYIDRRSWPPMYDGLPEHFRTIVGLSGFEQFWTSSCFWRDDDASEWKTGLREFPIDPDGRGDFDCCRLLFRDFSSSEDQLLESLAEYYEAFTFENRHILKALERRDFRRAIKTKRGNVDGYAALLEMLSPNASPP